MTLPAIAGASPGRDIRRRPLTLPPRAATRARR